MIDYNKYPNLCDIEYSSHLLVYSLITNPSESQCQQVKGLLTKIHLECRNLGKDSLKAYKKKLQTELTAFIKGKDSLFSIFPRTSEWISVAVTLMRWPEWFIISDDELVHYNQTMGDHLNDIKPLCLGEKEWIYENKLKSHGNICETILLEQDNISKYIMKNSTSLTEEEADSIPLKVVDILDTIRNLVIFRIPSEYANENEWLKAISYIRYRAEKVEERVWSIFGGQAEPDDFTLSESNCPLSENAAVSRIMFKLGWKSRKITMCAGNLFHLQYPDNRVAQPGQICVKCYAGYYTVACGKGPARKVRYVYNTFPETQNLLTPIANLIQDADKIYDQWEAYNNQTQAFDAHVHLVRDMFCSDATGYSDYLCREVYSYLLELMGFSSQLISLVMDIFSYPIRVDGKFYQVPYGAMQGVKLLVFIMNHANRLMGIIAHRLAMSIMDDRNDLDAKNEILTHYIGRPNAGDDYIVMLSSKCFPEEVDLEIATFACFNSPCNRLKSAVLSEDGYIDYCSKYYGIDPTTEQITGITGISPKILGKVPYAVKDFSEVFKIMDVAHVKHNPCLETFEKCLPYCRKYLQEGCNLKLHYESEDADLARKIQYFSQIPYSLGGLSDCDPDPARLLDRLEIVAERILSDYQPDVSGLFSICNRLSDLQGTNLYIAFGTSLRGGMNQFIKVFSYIKTMRDTKEYDESKIKDIASTLSRYERSTNRGFSYSAKVSTYDRNTRTSDIDIVSSSRVKTPTLDRLTIPDSMLSYCLLEECLSDEGFFEIYNIRKYITLKTLYDKYRSNLVIYHNAAMHEFLGYKHNGKIVRITAIDSSYRPDEFKSYNDLPEGEEKELCRILYGLPRAIQVYRILRDNKNNLASQLTDEVMHEGLISRTIDALNKRVNDRTNAAIKRNDEQYSRQLVNQLIAKYL